MPPVRPTMRSLAAEAGVSPMTVSLALRNSGAVSGATRRRIQRLAAARGYRPDPTIARLMHHLRLREPERFQANIVGLVERWPRQRSDAGGFLTRLRQGLEMRATALGFAFSTLTLDAYRTGEQLQRVLRSRGVEGLVILPLRRATDLSGLLDWTQFTTVAATPSLLAPIFHSVMPNHFDNMLAVCGELTRAGFRRIGLAIASDWDRRVKHRWAGGMAWQNLFGGTHGVPPLITPEPGPHLEADRFAAWLASHRPDVVISDATNQTLVATGLLMLPPGDRPQIVTMNWPEPGADAGMDQRPEQLGMASIDVLAGLLMRGEKGVPLLPQTTMIDGRWVEGTLNESRQVKVARSVRRPSIRATKSTVAGGQSSSRRA